MEIARLSTHPVLISPGARLDPSVYDAFHRQIPGGYIAYRDARRGLESDLLLLADDCRMRTCAHLMAVTGIAALPMRDGELDVEHPDLDDDARREVRDASLMMRMRSGPQIPVGRTDRLTRPMVERYEPLVREWWENTPLPGMDVHDRFQQLALLEDAICSPLDAERHRRTEEHFLALRRFARPDAPVGLRRRPSLAYTCWQVLNHPDMSSIRKVVREIDPDDLDALFLKTVGHGGERVELGIEGLVIHRG